MYVYTRSLLESQESVGCEGKKNPSGFYLLSLSTSLALTHSHFVCCIHTHIHSYTPGDGALVGMEEVPGVREQSVHTSVDVKPDQSASKVPSSLAFRVYISGPSLIYIHIYFWLSYGFIFPINSARVM